MKIILLTNKMCHCVDIEQELELLGYGYTRFDVEEAPALAKQFGIRHCPTLIINDSQVIPIDESNITNLRQLLTTK